MKGMVFTGFLRMVEERYGFDMVDSVIESSRVSTEGAYTSIGTYPLADFVMLLTALAQETGSTTNELLREFGEYLFAGLATGHVELLEGCQTAFDVLLKLDGVIHVEVAKLYPESELPRFQSQLLSEKELEMIYVSDRRLPDLAEGLLHGCLRHFGHQRYDLHREDFEDGRTRFLIALDD